jgi:hypothetical protein
MRCARGVCVRVRLIGFRGGDTAHDETACALGRRGVSGVACGAKGGVTVVGVEPSGGRRQALAALRLATPPNVHLSKAELLGA